MQCAVVTGANGFIGNAVIKELQKHGVRVIALGHNSKKNILHNIKYLSFELENVDQIYEELSCENVEVFYHFAWKGSAGEDRADSALQLMNAKWTVDCLRLAKKIGCRRFVCAGSIMEKEAFEAAYMQENRPGMGYIYGSGKLAAHMMCMSVAAQLGVELVWGRITKAYGPGEVSPRMLNTTIRKIIAKEPLQFTQGIQNYDFVYIEDVARAFYLMGDRGKAFSHYLIGSSEAKPLREFLLELKETLAPEQEFLFGDVPYTGVMMPLEDFDCSFTERELGFKAEVSFKKGVCKTMEWIKEYDK